MNKKIIVSSISSVLLSLPTFILAFSHPDLPTNFSGGVNALITTFLGILWPIAVAFFIVMFVIAGFKFATAAGDPEKVKVARDSVIYGSVGTVVALIAFSIVAIMKIQIGV